jgi:hypothetical protein
MVFNGLHGVITPKTVLFRYLYVFLLGVRSENLEVGDPDIFSEPMPCAECSGFLWRPSRDGYQVSLLVT